MTNSTDLTEYCSLIARQAREAATRLVNISTEQKNRWLRDAARRLRDMEELVMSANQSDVDSAPDFQLTDAEIDRLRLTKNRIEAMAAGMEQVAELPDPCGSVIESRKRPNGLEINKVRVPLGVVFFIYESRPNVTADAAAICVKSGNAVILRGGKEAANSSRAIVDVLQHAANECGLPQFAVQLVATSDRDAVGKLLKMSKLIDLVIPRGGEGLIRRVVEEAKMPVMKHFTGNCHVYVDQSAELEMAQSIVVNAKCQRMGVCNAAESMLVHRDVATKFLPKLAGALRNHEVELRADKPSRSILEAAGGYYKLTMITPADLDAEYLGPILSVCLVDNVDQAISHINKHGSGHTDVIIATDNQAIDAFTTQVDSAAVIVNASTRFNDGAEFGLGAEIGISTDKFHARGPCGLEELTSYKYVVRGSGQIRS